MSNWRIKKYLRQEEAPQPVKNHLKYQMQYTEDWRDWREEIGLAIGTMSRDGAEYNDKGVKVNQEDDAAINRSNNPNGIEFDGTEYMEHLRELAE